jgi:hypothetical protein
LVALEREKNAAAEDGSQALLEVSVNPACHVQLLTFVVRHENGCWKLRIRLGKNANSVLKQKQQRRRSCMICKTR